MVDAVNLAETFTAVVLGALQNANVIFAVEGEQDPVRLVSSVIGQEGEQTGYYRAILDKVPSEKPFLTTVPPEFAFSALQNFIVSCPFAISEIAIPVIPGIMVNGAVIGTLAAKDQTVTYTADLTSSGAAAKYVGGNGDGLFLTYTSGQLLPIPVPITNVKWSGKVVTFDATFPYAEYVLDGFTHGALTVGKTFADASAVAPAALAGPALIQVNTYLY